MCLLSVDKHVRGVKPAIKVGYVQGRIGQLGIVVVMGQLGHDLAVVGISAVGQPTIIYCAVVLRQVRETEELHLQVLGNQAVCWHRFIQVYTLLITSSLVMALYDFTEYLCGSLMQVGLFIDAERSIKVVARSATVGLLDDSLYFKFGHTVPCIALQVVQAEEYEGAQEMGYL